MPKSVWVSHHTCIIYHRKCYCPFCSSGYWRKTGYHPTYAIPLVSQYVGLILATIPIAFLMQKYSRRVGFIIGNIGGLIGAGFSILGVIESHLIYFSIGLFLLGLLLVLHNNSVLPQLKKPPFLYEQKPLA